MLNNFFLGVGDRLGEYNPQFLRELKSRLSWRNVGITFLLSVTIQAVVWLSQYAKLPTARQPYNYNPYCLAHLDGYKCQLDAWGNPIINWTKWWLETCSGISTVMFAGLFAGGVYLLASNFSQEERRGTLDFLRLTPQPASQIVAGKLLGVPILVYLGTLLVIPFQLFAAHQAHIARINVLSWDLLMASVAVLLYLAAVLVSLWFKAPAILLAAAALGFSSPMSTVSSSWNWDGRKYIVWFGLQLGNQVLAYLLWVGLTTVGIYWIYQAIRRRYLKPTATVLSKKQTYIFSGCLHGGLLGFAFDGKNLMSPPFGLSGSDYTTFNETVISVFSLAWLLLLIPLLLPSRQSLVEWSRQKPLGKNYSLLPDLLRNEKSPGVLAVAVNVAIATAVWLPLSVLFMDVHLLPKALLGILMTTLLAMIYSLIAHWVLFWQVNHQPFWSAGIVGTMIALPIASSAIFGFGRSANENSAFLLTPLLWTSLQKVSGNISFVLCLIMLGVTLWLNLKLRQVLNKAGRSESYQNLAAS